MKQKLALFNKVSNFVNLQVTSHRWRFRITEAKLRVIGICQDILCQDHEAGIFFFSF